MLYKLKNANLNSTMKEETISRNDKRLKSHTASGKYLILIALLCSSTFGLFAQDIITKKDGTEIKVKVTEIGTNEVKYIRFGTSLPIYTLLKSEIFMIKYENGAKDIFKEETEQKVNTQQQINANNTQLSNSNQTTYKYTLGNPINPVGGRKSAWGSGIASLFIPGLGQFINGDVGGGFLFLGSNIACNLLRLNAEDETLAIIGLMGGLTVNICSIINAAYGAKNVNIARGYQLANNTYLQIQPTIIPQNNLFANRDYAYGMNFRVSF